MKKDPTRSDYRKADKIRPGVWFIILAVLYLGLTAWALYFACTMYVTVKETICKSAVFVDTVNVGKQEKPTWVGAQSLGTQLYIFSKEAEYTQEAFGEVFTKHSDTIESFPAELEVIEQQFKDLRSDFSSREVANFENPKQVNRKTSSNLACFEDGVFGPHTQEGTTLGDFQAETNIRVGNRIEAIQTIQKDGEKLM